MSSVLNTKVSCFKNYEITYNPVEINLISWLNNSKYAKEIQQLRAVEDKSERDSIKAMLPAITPSGTFSYRSCNYLIRHSGLLQFDIDFQHNEHIDNYFELKEELCKIQNIAYCGLSASGRGFWGLVPIAYPEQHKEHFDALKMDFERFGIVIDEKPKNVASLRGYSYDPEGYFNHQAKVYKKFILPKKRERHFTPSYNQDQTRDKVEKLINQIVQSGIDITGSYQTWFEIGCSLANEFGEDGREYFHLISQYHPEYKEQATDKQFSYCLKHNYRYQINTFFHYCKLVGILIMNEISVTEKVKPSANRIKIEHSDKYLAEMIPGCPF